METISTLIPEAGKTCDYCDDSAVIVFSYRESNSDYRTCGTHSVLHTCRDPRAQQSFTRSMLATRESERESKEWARGMRDIFAPVHVMAMRFGMILETLADDNLEDLPAIFEDIPHDHPVWGSLR